MYIEEAALLYDMPEIIWYVWEIYKFEKKTKYKLETLNINKLTRLSFDVWLTHSTWPSLPKPLPGS